MRLLVIDTTSLQRDTPPRTGPEVELLRWQVLGTFMEDAINRLEDLSTRFADLSARLARIEAQLAPPPAPRRRRKTVDGN